MWIIEIDGRPAGLAQHYEHEDYPEHDIAVDIPDAVGIDYLLCAEHAGRGLGPAVLDAFADLVFELTSGAGCCVATPAQEDRPSWVALERAGFQRRGPADRRENLPPGPTCGSAARRPAPTDRQPNSPPASYDVHHPGSMPSLDE